MLKSDNDSGHFFYLDGLYFNRRLVNNKKFSQLAEVKLTVRFKASDRRLRTDIFWDRKTLSFSLRSLPSVTAVSSVMARVSPVFENPCLTQTVAS